IFAASADPFGTNPSGTCQLFSIRTIGAGLRPLTHFSQPEYSAGGGSPGCAIPPLGLDPPTGIVVFYAPSDPFGTNPYVTSSSSSARTGRFGSSRRRAAWSPRWTAR